MKNFSFHFIYLTTLVLAISFIWTVSAQWTQCSDDASCTDLCGYAGAGRCVNGTHCLCETCPQRSTAELSLAYSVKICTPEPFCQLKCPGPTFSFKTGKIYSGHICSDVADPLDVTCICFCMPTTLASLGTVLRCPVLPKMADIPIIG